MALWLLYRYGALYSTKYQSLVLLMYYCSHGTVYLLCPWADAFHRLRQLSFSCKNRSLLGREVVSLLRYNAHRRYRIYRNIDSDSGRSCRHQAYRRWGLSQYPHPRIFIQRWDSRVERAGGIHLARICDGRWWQRQRFVLYFQARANENPKNAKQQSVCIFCGRKHRCQ